MDGDLKELFSKGNAKLSTKQYREKYAKIAEVKSNLGKLYYQRTQLKKEGDERGAHILTNVINTVKSTQLDLQAQVKDQYIVKLPTKRIIIKQSTIRKSKNPRQYIENKIREYEGKQIEKELDKGNLKQAITLMRLHNAFEFKTKNKKQERKLDQLNEEIIEMAEEQEFDEFDEISESIDEFLMPAQQYKIIITTKGNIINITKIAG